MSPKQTDVKTRIRELEATVRGLTQEVVEANERIHELEEALGEGGPRRGDEPGVRSGPEDEAATTDGATGTKQMGGADEGDDETASDLDDIIVA